MEDSTHMGGEWQQVRFSFGDNGPKVHRESMMTEREKPWGNPVKNQAPKESTLKTPGDFRKFTELMKKVVPKPSASHVRASDRS
jgi:hypothetical protein